MAFSEQVSSMSVCVWVSATDADVSVCICGLVIIGCRAMLAREGRMYACVCVCVCVLR